MPLIKHTHKKHRNIHKENEKRRRKERKQIAHFKRYYKPNPKSPEYDPDKPYYTHVANISGDEKDPELYSPHTPDGPPPGWSPKEDSLEKLMKQMKSMKIKKPTKKGGESGRKTRKQIAKRKRITKKTQSKTHQKYT